MSLSCSWVATPSAEYTSMNQRLRIAILPIPLGVDIRSLSSITTVEQERSPEDEDAELVATLESVKAEARWIFESRLAVRHLFQFVPSERTDAAMELIGIRPGEVPTAGQIVELGSELEADLVVRATIEDYGKVRWQWLLAGMLTDMTVDNFILGLATAWNPVALSASVGWDLLTSAPVWFGGGYLFGIALRPVSVEARAYETRQGYPIWQDMETAMYAWGALRALPQTERRKKEHQLWINLNVAVESLADSLAAHFSHCLFGRNFTS